jgi:hypothetical protein
MTGMKTQVAATYVAGQFKPDEILPLAEDTRVTLTVEVRDGQTEDTQSWDPEKARAAWESLKEWIRKHPLHGLGRRLTRDELYERR